MREATRVYLGGWRGGALARSAAELCTDESPRSDRSRRAGGKAAEPEAAQAIDAALEAIEDALRAGESVQLTGFGKFHVAQYTGRAGVNPRTGEPIDVPTTAVPRFTQGCAEAGRSLTASFAARVTDAVARRQSQIVLGLDPDPAALWPAAAPAAEGPAAPPIAPGAPSSSTAGC